LREIADISEMNTLQQRLLALAIFIVAMSGATYLIMAFVYSVPEWVVNVLFYALIAAFVFACLKWLATRTRR